MGDLTTITNSPVPAPARLPALGAPELSVNYLAQMKEIIEVMLGRRGSDWDRAVTFRDLQAGGLGGYLPGGSVAQGSPAVFDPGTGTITVGGGSPVNIDAALRNSAAYKALMSRIGSAEELANLPELISSQISTALADLARERKADIRTVENKIQTNQLSMASRLTDITASLEGAAAGVREFDAAYADTMRAVALRVETVAAALDTAGGGVIAQELLEATADAVEGLKGQWSLKIQTNPTGGQPPVIAGIALAVEDPIAGPGTSSLVFMAESFGFYTNNGTLLPFSIVGDQITFNGNVLINGTLMFGEDGRLLITSAAPGTENAALVPIINSAAGTALIGRGMSAEGGIITKTAPVNAWLQADCYSKDSFTGGAFASFRIIAPVTGEIMAGLTLDPLENAGYDTIDHAIYIPASGALSIYQNGTVIKAGAAQAAVGDVLAVVYDGVTVKYLINGAVMHSVTQSDAAQKLYFDAAFTTLGDKLGNVQFGPMSNGAAGAQAAAALPGINLAVAAKLNKNTDDVLGARLLLGGNGKIQLSDDANNTTVIAPSGIVGLKNGQTNYSQSTTGAVIAREFDAIDLNGEVLFSTGKTLAQQTMSAPNLAARLSSWPTFDGGAVQYASAGDVRFANGEYLHLPANGNSYVGASSNPLNIPPGAYYTVSFDAYCDGAARTLNADVYGFGVDSAGTAIALTNGHKRYKFTEVMPNNADSRKAWLRLFSGGSGSSIVISNVKVEMGSTATPWSDNVITKDNVSTFIQAAAIGLALIDRASIANLSALVAFLGNVQIGIGGALWAGQTAYDTGTGLRLGTDGAGDPYFSTRSASGKYFRLRPSTDTFETNLMKLNNPVLDDFTVSASGTLGGSYANGSATYGTITLSIAGGRAPYMIRWFLSIRYKTSPTSRIDINGGADTSATISGTGTNCETTATLTAVVMDENKRAQILNFNCQTSHGTPP